MVIKNDPGQPIVWTAFALLIAGLALTFYFPRRRAWVRIDGARIGLAFLADRYVAADAEFGRLRSTVARELDVAAIDANARAPDRNDR